MQIKENSQDQVFSGFRYFNFMVWMVWFNGGSNGAMDEAVPLILINTFLAASLVC